MSTEEDLQAISMHVMAMPGVPAHHAEHAGACLSTQTFRRRQ
jgi:hypothetical protein